MAKAKKYLATITKEQVIEVILELYDARKEAKYYLEFYLSPYCEAEPEKRKKASNENSSLQGTSQCPPLLSKCKKIVSDFQKLNANPSHTADLMLFFIKQGSAYSATYGGGMSEPSYTVFVNNFRKYMDYIFMNGLLIDLYERIERLIRLLVIADMIPQRNGRRFMGGTDNMDSAIECNFFSAKVRRKHFSGNRSRGVFLAFG